MATWEQDIVAAFEKLGGSARYDDLYAEIQLTRSNLPPTWQAIVRRIIQDRSSDSAGFKHGDDDFFSVEGLGAGVWGLRRFLKDTPIAIDLPFGNEHPLKVLSHTYRILRDTVLARKIKLMHQDQCQICGYVVTLSDGSTYSEAHHIRPIGSPHHGPDIPGNIIVLCPNHHVLCDYGAILLRKSDLPPMLGHEVSQEYIDFHNERISKVKSK